MNRIKSTSLVAAIVILMSSWSTQLMAGSFGVGISGLGVLAETSGTETMKGNIKSTKNGVNGTGFAPAGYIQYTFGDRSNGFVIGLEKIPGAVTLGAKETNRIDYVAGSKGAGQHNSLKSGPVVTQIAKAEISNHWGAFVETPGFAGLFLKAGVSQVDLITQESLATGSKYGDDTMEGFTLGIGFKGTSESGIHVKFAYEVTDYGSVSLKSTGSDVSSTIDADVQTYAGRLSIGYNF